MFVSFQRSPKAFEVISIGQGSEFAFARIPGPAWYGPCSCSGASRAAQHPFQKDPSICQCHLSSVPYIPSSEPPLCWPEIRDKVVIVSWKPAQPTLGRCIQLFIKEQINGWMGEKGIEKLGEWKKIKERKRGQDKDYGWCFFSLKAEVTQRILASFSMELQHWSFKCGFKIIHWKGE